MPVTMTNLIQQHGWRWGSDSWHEQTGRLNTVEGDWWVSECSWWEWTQVTGVKLMAGQKKDWGKSGEMAKLKTRQKHRTWQKTLKCILHNWSMWRFGKDIKTRVLISQQGFLLRVDIVRKTFFLIYFFYFRYFSFSYPQMSKYINKNKLLEIISKV